jgi:hypothetical protein
MDTINVSLASWIIQDGNYGDFEAGQNYCFALEYYAPQPLERAKFGSRMIKRASAYRYDVCGQVLYCTEEVCVIDFGLRAYHEEPKEVVRVGEWLRGRIHLGIDSFSYFETFKDYPGMPNLFYRFHVSTILLESTPWVRNRYEEYPNYIERDQTREGFVPVARTDALKDDDGNADYILQCQIIEDAT